MSSPIVNAAASPTPPVQDVNVFVLSGTAASQRIEIPDSWRNHFITITADGDDFYLAFGDSAMVADQTSTTTVTAADTVSFGGSECIKLADGAVRNFDLRQTRDSVTHFAWKGSGTAGYLRIERSSGAAALG